MHTGHDANCAIGCSSAPPLALFVEDGEDIPLLEGELVRVVRVRLLRKKKKK